MLHLSLNFSNDHRAKTKRPNKAVTESTPGEVGQVSQRLGKNNNAKCNQNSNLGQVYKLSNLEI